MKRKIINVRTHIGGLHGKTSYDSAKDKAEFDANEFGVVVHLPNRPDILVPWTNCIECLLGDETEEEKRGPGRPPGPKAA